MNNRPKPDARIFHIDVDVLKQNMGMFHIDAEITAKADSELSLIAILNALQPHSLDEQKIISARREGIITEHTSWINTLRRDESPPVDGTISVPYLVSRIRELAPPKTLILNEGISNYIPVWAHSLPSPGCMLTSGGTSLGWSLGAAIGASIAQRTYNESINYGLIAVIVGDGSFLFGVPSSAYWIAHRYNTVCLFSFLK